MQGTICSREKHEHFPLYISIGPPALRLQSTFITLSYSVLAQRQHTFMCLSHVFLQIPLAPQ